VKIELNNIIGKKMIELVYLNPNITRKEADDLVKESHKRRDELLKEVIEASEKLGGKSGCDLLAATLPFILML